MDLKLLMPFSNSKKRGLSLIAPVEWPYSSFYVSDFEHRVASLRLVLSQNMEHDVKGLQVYNPWTVPRSAVSSLNLF